ncbi:MAG: transketolase [Alphaproteobacteria bacterium]|uniref:transketolase n=1 Tax=Aestuariivirga sp. TaxID=2650926 RepID=UPI00301936F9|nr:transketolase [Alphaproteobacteria bacterium]
MRTQFCEALVARAKDSSLVFLTGDLGFMALEPLRDALGARFINAGVAEQNMISVAAGLAKQGFDAWTYSIAPFIYARAFEQIRNDVTFHDLPVRLVGNGGGYGYGVMGPTHHAIEDYGVLLTLPGLKAFAPVFDEDVSHVIDRLSAESGPTYLRLGRGEAPSGYQVPRYAPWRCLVQGPGPVVIAVGPLAGSYISSCLSMPQDRRPSLWALAELPLESSPIPHALAAQIATARRLIVAEEHVARGSFGSELARNLMMSGHGLERFVHLSATSHHLSGYGSQSFMRKKSKLDPAALVAAVEALS